MHDSSFTGRVDVYQTITDRIIQAVELGAGKFVMPWHGPSIADGRPTNIATHAVYRGVNVLGLWAESMLQGYRSRYWASYRQWASLGGQVRRGQRGTPIVFYKLLSEEPDEAGEDPPRAPWIIKTSKVFNADQVEYRAIWEPAPQAVQILGQAEEFVAATGAEVRHGLAHACFIPKFDRIEMPDRSAFVGSPTSSPTHTYYSTLFHELTHWSGAAHRLDRDLSGRFGDQAYAAEELVAELGAAFLCADLEIANEPRPDHAAYVAQWLRIMRSDRRAVFTAAQRARDAAMYMLRLHEERAVRI